MPTRWRPAWRASAKPARCSRMPTTSPKWWPAPARWRREIEEQGGLPDSGAGERRRRRPDRRASRPGSSERSRVVALEPELAPTLYRAREAGEPVDVDGERHRRRFAGRAAHRRASPGRSRSATCAMRCCCPTRRSARRSCGCGRRLKLAVEPAAALPLAALQTGAYRAARRREGLPDRLRREPRSGDAWLDSSAVVDVDHPRHAELVVPACRSRAAQKVGA